MLKLLFAVVALMIVIGCQTEGESGARVESDDRSASPVTDNNNRSTGGASPLHANPEHENVGGIMAAKLAHAHGALEGIARQDFKIVAANARSLHDLSEKADWQMHRTMEYNLYSDQFRWHVSELARHADAKNVHAATLDYVQMVMACVQCHDYMKQSGLVSLDGKSLQALLDEAR